MEAAAEYLPIQARFTYRVLWETLAVQKKQQKREKVSLCNKRNTTNANTLKFKKV